VLFKLNVQYYTIEILSSNGLAIRENPQKAFKKKYPSSTDAQQARSRYRFARHELEFTPESYIWLCISISVCTCTIQAGNDDKKHFNPDQIAFSKKNENFG